MDIVERLRSHWGKFGVSRGDFVTYSHSAADEIERSRKEIKQLREALKDISCCCEGKCYYKYDICAHKMAANALKEEE
jgi:hypothetical protein